MKKINNHIQLEDEFNVIEYKHHRSGLIQVILKKWFQDNILESFSESPANNIQLELDKYLNFETSISIIEKSEGRISGAINFKKDNGELCVVDFCVLSAGPNFNSL